MTELNAEHAKRRAALGRYRVMAIITGTFLLLVTFGVVLKYVVGVDNPTFVSITSAIAIVHGWIYVVYLVTAVDLWTRMKWTLGRLLSSRLAAWSPACPSSRNGG